MAKRTNNNLQNITHKTKDRVTRTPLKIDLYSTTTTSINKYDRNILTFIYRLN